MVELRTFEDTTEQQRESIDQQRKSDERRDYQHLYASSIKYLEHDKESVKLGAVYGLIRLARNSRLSDDPWASDVADILRAHIDSITEENRSNYKKGFKPSSYISTILRLFIPHKQDTPEKNPFRILQLDLSGLYLAGANLKDLYMKSANLTNVDLRDTDLKEADLTSADLRGTDLRGADLKGADLKNADLRGLDLKTVGLKGLDVRGADFRSTDLSGLDLRDMDLRGVDLRGANLKNTDLRGADLSGANYTSEDLRGAILDRNKPLAGSIGDTDEDRPQV